MPLGLSLMTLLIRQHTSIHPLQSQFMLLQACKLAKLPRAVAEAIKPQCIGLCSCKGESTTTVLTRRVMSAELFTSKVVYQSAFPTAVAAADDRSAEEVQTEVQRAQAEVEVLFYSCVHLMSRYSQCFVLRQPTQQEPPPQESAKPHWVHPVSCIHPMWILRRLVAYP